VKESPISVLHDQAKQRKLECWFELLEQREPTISAPSCFFMEVVQLVR
jgi:hypothetical protein